MNAPVRTLLSIALVVLLGSCASIMSGSRQEIDISSDPPAQLRIESGTGELFFEGFAPSVVDLPRANSYDLTVSAPGYEDYRVTIRQDFNVWVIGNVVVGAVVIGTGIDLLTGAFWNLTPEFIHVELEQRPSAQAAGPDTVVVVTAIDNHGRETVYAAPLERM